MMYVMTLSSALYDQSLVVLALGLLITDNVRLATEVALIGLAFKFVRQLLQALVVPLTGVQTPLFAGSTPRTASKGSDGLRQPDPLPDPGLAAGGGRVDYHVAQPADAALFAAE